MSSMIPNPMTSPGGNAPGATVSAPPTDDPNFQVPDAPAYGTPGNLMLPSFDSAVQSVPPTGADAQYLASEAALRSSIAQKYQAILQQLGYTDPSTGSTIQGRTVQDANIKLAQLQHDMQQAAMATTRNAQQNGTIFSGIRGQQLADAEYPTLQAEGQLGLDTTRSLSDQYDNAQGLISDYNSQNNQLLAEAASRAAAGITASPPAGGSIGPSGGGGGVGTQVTSPADTYVPQPAQPLGAVGQAWAPATPNSPGMNLPAWFNAPMARPQAWAAAPATPTPSIFGSGIGNGGTPIHSAADIGAAAGAALASHAAQIAKNA